MMNTWSQWLYPAATVIALLLAGVALRAARRSDVAARALKRASDEELARLTQEMRALCSGAVGLGDRLRRLERDQRSLADRHERLELKDPGERPYAQAIRLVHSGAPVAEIAESCGLTRSEAELLKMLHSVDKAS